MTIKKKSKTSKEKTSSTKKVKKASESASVSNKVVLSNLRSSYMFVTELKASEDDPEKKTCSCTILIPKSDKAQCKKVRQTMLKVVKKAFGDNVNIFKSTTLKSCLKDGTKLYEDPENTAGEEVNDHYVLRCRMYSLPVILDRNRERVIDPGELSDIIISGYRFNFSVLFKTYDVKLKSGGKAKGIKAEINCLQFVRKDDPLGGSVDIEGDFDVLESEEDDYDEFDEE